MSGRLLLLVDLAVANTVAAIWIAVFLQPQLLGRPPAGVDAGMRVAVVPLDTGSAWLLFLVGIVLLLWNFAWLVRRRPRRLPSQWVVSEAASGQVRVARDAIETALRVAGEALPEVTRMRVHVDNSNPKRLLVTGQYACGDGIDHLLASERLRRGLQARFGELVRLGEGVRSEFALEFQGFVGKASKAVVEEQREPEEPEPFTGPQYPIDDEP